MTTRSAAAPVVTARMRNRTAKPPAKQPGKALAKANAEKPAPEKRSYTATGVTDIFLVTSATQSGRRNVRTMLAADQLDAYTTHRKHYPDDEIVKVDECCRHCGEPISREAPISGMSVNDEPGYAAHGDRSVTALAPVMTQSLDGVDTVWRVWTPTAEGSYQPGLVFTNEKDAMAWADADAQGRA